MHDLGETREGHYRSRLQVFKRTVSSLGALQISPGSSQLGRPQAPVRQIWHRQFHKTQNPGYHRSEAQAEFGVAREETDGPREWLIQRLSKCTPTRSVPHPHGLPDEGCR